MLGPNGAGKTTLSLIVSGLLEPTEGTVYVMGEDVRRLRRRVCEKYVSLYLSGYMGLMRAFLRTPALKYLIVAGAMHWVRGDLRRRAEEALKLVGLWEWRDEWPARFSSGMQVKLMLAELLMYDKPILVLDEPTVHLDPASCKDIWDVLRRLAREERKTILLTTQNMEEAEYLCDRVMLLNAGRIIAIASPEELREASTKVERISVVVEGGSAKALAKQLRELPGVLSVNVKGSAMTVQAEKGAVKPAEIVELAAKAGCELRSLSYEKPTLSEVFRMLVRGGGA